MSKKWRCRRHCCHSIVAWTTAVVHARFVSHLRVANRLRRLCPQGTRFPAVPAGGLGAEPLSLMPQHFPREPAKRCSRALAADQGFFDSLNGTIAPSITAMASPFPPKETILNDCRFNHAIYQRCTTAMFSFESMAVVDELLILRSFRLLTLIWQIRCCVSRG